MNATISRFKSYFSILDERIDKDSYVIQKILINTDLYDYHPIKWSNYNPVSINDMKTQSNA